MDSTSTTVTEEQMEQANALFWSQMLGVEMRRVDSAHCEWMEEVHIAGWCVLSGAWSGRIEVRMTHGLAMMATAMMLALPEEHVREADLMDATKEIANMIVGTIKSTLPRPCSMTVPEASAASGAETLRAAMGRSARFCHEQGELIVRLIEESDERV